MCVTNIVVILSQQRSRFQKTFFTPALPLDGYCLRIDDCMNSVNPFDLSKALDGAAKAHLDPSVSRFI